MVYIVLKKMGKSVYAYLYKCTRIKGIPKQKYVAYLGKINGIPKSKLKNVKTKIDFKNLVKRKKS
jgi:hypothetical protein